MLTLRDVSKQFGATQALRHVDLAVEPGRTTVLIGPSGCGKSTLLRLMIGLIRPDTGTIQFDGAALHERTLRAARHRMGYVIQEGGLFPHLTCRRNVTLLPRHLGWSEERTEARLRELAALVHLPVERLADYPAQLSGGQRRRVSLMRGLMLDPDVLLLDEPMGALDPMIRAELQRDLRGIFRALEKTVVLVTHNMGEAAFLADTIVLLRAGEIVQRGALRDLLDAPASGFVTQFIRAQRSPLDVEIVDRES